MKYTLLLLFISVVACQQPTMTGNDESDIRFSTSSSVGQLSESAPTATGVVTWTNRPGHAGKITTADGSVYTYNVNAGHTVNGFRPVVGNAVIFNTGTGASARFVRLADIPDDDDDSDDDADDDNGGDNPPPPPPLW